MSPLFAGFYLKKQLHIPKMSLVATQRSTFFRQKFMLDVSLYKPEMFVFMDDTGTESYKALRMHSYSLCGIPAKYHKPLYSKGISCVCNCCNVHRGYCWPWNQSRSQYWWKLLQFCGDDLASTFTTIWWPFMSSTAVYSPMSYMYSHCVHYYHPGIHLGWPYFFGLTIFLQMPSWSEYPWMA